MNTLEVGTAVEKETEEEEESQSQQKPKPRTRMKRVKMRRERERERFPMLQIYFIISFSSSHFTMCHTLYLTGYIHYTHSTLYLSFALLFTTVQFKT